MNEIGIINVSVWVEIWLSAIYLALIPMPALIVRVCFIRIGEARRLKWCT